MAASMARRFALGAAARKVIASRTNTCIVSQTWTRTAFFRRQKDSDEDSEMTVVEEEAQPFASPLSLASTFKKRVGLQTVRGYTPPDDVEERLHKIAADICGKTADFENSQFENNRIKFKFLTTAMSEFDHFISNSALNNITTVKDAVTFFSTPVRDTSLYDDITKLDLPPNLHIQLEPNRFDPETDTMFGGKTAFPDRPTIVSSLKYQRKYGKKQ